MGLLDRVLLVGVHLEELADALLLALGGVEDHIALGDLAGVDAHVDEIVNLHLFIKVFPIIFSLRHGTYSSTLSILL